MSKRVKWTVEFEVSDIWIADGFRLTDEVAQEMIAERLGFAYHWEVSGKVKKSPTGQQIKAAEKRAGSQS